MASTYTLQAALVLALTVSVRAAEPSKSGGAGSHGSDELTPADYRNIELQWYLGYVWAALIGSLLAYRVLIYGINYVRTIVCLSNDTQRYFARPNEHFGKLKKYFIDAPLLRTRHNREFKLSAAINVGTLPSRLQALFLVGYFGMNVAFCVISIDWSGKTSAVLGQFRARTGVLAVMNMLPLFLLATRNNPLIKALNISFDSYNLIHRWIGRIVVLEALAHTLAWLINKVNTAGWAAVQKSLANSQLIMTGMIGTIAMLALLLQSPSPIRHAFYETFLHVHILLAGLAVGGVWIHLKDLEQLKIMYAVVALWAIERAWRFFKILRRNVGNGGTQAVLEALPGDAVRVTLKMARPWKFRPGQHVYLYIPSIGLWTSHPFSLAWSEEEQDLNNEKLVMSRQDVFEQQKTSMSLIIRRRTGFTDKLYTKAASAPAQKITTLAFVEGPYGSESLHSYGTVMLFAAGVGITHQVPHVRDLVAGFANGTVATRKVTLVWIIQSPEHLEWIRPWMTTILGMDKRRDVLKILLFVTRPRSTKEIHSPSASVQMFPGKPNIQSLVDMEAEKQVGAMAVTVCGTGSLSDDVRRAARLRHTTHNIDFIENAFSW